MKWSELLLILAALQASLSQNIEVSQIPEVNVIEGSTANLECSYNMSNLDLPTGQTDQSKTLTDTGMYFCEVEFSGQMQIKGHSKGTFLNVTGEGVLFIFIHIYYL
ncbi:hypothetical protein XELAEV_18023783mg [Xenopus laevis]|uniref:Uncharacterized protein n=1 Tax=Xenopus laevis TaxID=8355 RepID=A0A974D4U0_XENLA|nr:hypothetical protein XELAEV_18023783mg [Xenopus laevis]